MKISSNKGFKRALICIVTVSALSAPAFAWFADPNKTGSGSLFGSDSSIGADQAAIDAEIKKEAEKCAEGEDGTLGGAIKNAQNIHLEMASIKPNIEELFSVNQDCFSGLSQMFDLSITIPSLASIISAAQDAVVKYAQKKVCTAVKEATSMVTSPINEGLNKINGMAGMADLNGLANGYVVKGLNSIDPELGASYNKAPKDPSYTSGSGFGTNQVSFPGTNPTTPPTTPTAPQTASVKSVQQNNVVTPNTEAAKNSTQSTEKSSDGSSGGLMKQITDLW